MKKKHWLYIVLVLIGTIGLTGCAVETDRVEAQYTTEINQELLNQHDQRHQEIMTEFQNGDYTLEDPLVVQDPYGRSPLSAIVLFETEEPKEITVTVEGESEATAISHTYLGSQTKHSIPVLGLYPDKENRVTLTGETESGETTAAELQLTTDPVPEDMLDVSVETVQPQKMAEGLTFLSPSRAYPTAVDSNGDVRWYAMPKSSNQMKRLKNGNMLLATMEEGQNQYNHLTEMDMLGRVHQSIFIDMENVIYSNPLHHDTIELENGNYLALLHDGGEEYVEDEMAELDRETGEVVHRINFKEVFPASMYEDYSGYNHGVGDWVHINTVWELKDEDALLLSIRQQDAILKLTYPEGEIEWLLAHPTGWPEELEEYLLEPTHESFKFPAGPHAVEELPDQDGDDETLDILLYDNNRIIARGNEEENEEYSQAIQYRIDQEEGTVEEVWSYGEERGKELYSGIVGDADYLPEANHVLMTSGRILDSEAEQRHSAIVEVTRTDNSEVIFELHYGPFGIDQFQQIYRAERMSLYPGG